MALQTSPGALVVGSSTAGADGNVSLVYFPGGYRGAISGIGVFYPDRRPAQRTGIAVDVEVRPARTGIRARRDEVLEAAAKKLLGRDVDLGPRLAAAIRNGALALHNPEPFGRALMVRGHSARHFDSQPWCTGTAPRHFDFQPWCTATAPGNFDFQPRCTATAPGNFDSEPWCTSTAPRNLDFQPRCTATAPRHFLERDRARAQHRDILISSHGAPPLRQGIWIPSHGASAQHQGISIPRQGARAHRKGISIPSQGAPAQRQDIFLNATVHGHSGWTFL